MSNVVYHPAASLMTGVKAEQEIAATPEADALQNAICDAVHAYYDYLDRHGLIWDEERGLPLAWALEVTYDRISYDIKLKGGAIDYRYGDGEDPPADGWLSE
jgi:hypothetical protein